MDNRKNSAQQILRFLILSLCAYMLMQSFFGKPKNGATPQRPEKTAPALALAFSGIAPVEPSTRPQPTPTVAAANAASTPAVPVVVSGAPITKANAAAEIKKLDAEIAASPNDGYAQWAMLRKGLIEQYVLGVMTTRPRPAGPFDFFIGMFSKLSATQNTYDQVIAHGGTDAVAAQATYQQGDLLWNQSVRTDGKPSALAASTLEQLIHKGRGSSAFTNLEILVPRAQMQAKSTAASTRGGAPTAFAVASLPPFEVPQGGFVPVTVGEMRGTLTAPFSFGIPDRVNSNYSNGTLYQIFDTVVKAYDRVTGHNPNLSFGLAILTLAIFTRIAMHPLMRRQYESMKGMQVIAPEMKKIQEKYKSKPPEEQTKMMGEIRDLQRRHGVNPMSGCGWGLVQMPIFLLLVYPMIQHYESKMDLAGASFLWIYNLAHPDLFLLAIYGVSMFVSFRLSSTPPTDPQQAQMQAVMSFAMPFVFPLFLLSYPSAFTLYWTTYNITSMILQYRLMKSADPSKTLMKSLMGTPAPVADGAPAIPARPQSKPASTRKPVTLSPTTMGEVVKSSNGAARNGDAAREVASPFNENGVAVQPESGAKTPGSSTPRRSVTRARQKRRY
jgi:YidC/Oxa1 family membrane protein insertase